MAGLLGGRAALGLAFASVLAAGLVMAVAGQRYAHLSGVSDLAAGSEGRVWAIVGEELWQFDASGYRLHAWSAAQLQLRPPLGGLAGDGAGGVWIGSHRSGRLQQLAADGSLQQQIDPARSSAGPLFNSLKLAFDARTRRLVVADTGNHRVLAFDASGALHATSRAPMRFPNGLASLRDGTILVAATNDHQLARLDGELALTPWSREHGDGLSAAQTWPVFVSAAPGGDIYASWHFGDLGLGSVLRYDRDGHVQQRIALPPDAEPQALLARADDVLIAARLDDGYHLLRRGRDGLAQPDFGDAALQWQLHQVSRTSARLQRIRGVAQGVLLLSAIALLLLALQERRRGELPAAVAIGLPETLPGVPWSARLQQFGLVLLYPVVFAVLLVLMLLLAPLWSDWPPLLRRALLFAVAIAALLPVFWWRRRSRAFRALRDQAFARWLRDWVPKLEQLLLPGEAVVAHAPGASAWRAGILVTTTHRVLLLPPLALFGARPRWQARWEHIGEGSERDSLWRWLLGADTGWLEWSAGDAQPPLRVLAVDTAMREQVQATMAEGRRRFLERTQILPLADARRAPAPATAPWSVALLSLCLPGLGQLQQRRTQAGVLFLLLSLAVLIPATSVWMPVIFRFADTAPGAPLRWALWYAVLVAIACADAVQYARRTTG